MKEYVTLSLETHLFFGKIMKEHSLFLLAGFPAKETELIRRADLFREEILADHVLRGANHYPRIPEHAQKGRC